ncbi:MAG: 6-bladed beta-propeller [Ignavibacteriae bacterium]|nr:6-bladed beta-propeller [Ignavibacteriota bacterium]
MTQDNNLSVFVIDSYRNYLYKFNSAGKFMKESFGSFGTGDGKFINPKGVAFYNKVLYIADTGNNRIVRYKLSTDLN